MIGIIDYGAGNLKSVEKAFSYLGYDVKISDDLEFLSSCDKIVLPGVGAFADCMNMIVQKKLDKVVYDAVDKNKPFLGICLGLQLLFESSEEGRFCKGLGVIKGHVRKFTDTSLKIPQIGWNMIKKANPESRLLDGIEDEYFYFVHSYYVDAADKSDVAAVCGYGIDFDAVCEKGNIFATQFHPEKSSDAGLKLLDNFAKL